MTLQYSHTLPATAAKRIAAAAQQIIRDELRRSEERQLLNELRSSELPDIEKLCEYLERTPLVQSAGEGAPVVAVTNEYLYKNLAIPPGKMKVLRETLAEDPRVQVHFTGGGQITLYYKRPTRRTHEETAAAPFGSNQ